MGGTFNLLAGQGRYLSNDDIGANTKAIQAKIRKRAVPGRLTISWKMMSLPFTLTFSLCDPFCILWSCAKLMSFSQKWGQIIYFLMQEPVRSCQQGFAHMHTLTKHSLCVSVLVGSKPTWLGYCAYFPLLYNIQNTTEHVLVLNQHTDARTGKRVQ